VGTVPLAPIVITAQDRTVICTGDTTTLVVTNVTGGNGVYTYAWTNAGQQTLSLADTLQVGVSADAGYTITVADQCGYVGDTLVQTLVPHPAPFILELTADTTLCLGDSITLWAHVSGGSGYYTVDWPEQEWTDPLLSVSPPENKTYTVYVYDQCGEVIGDQVHVGVEEPQVDIVATNLGQDDWKFEAATLPTFCRNYRWDLGDGTTSRESVVVHSYLDLEEHMVHLKVVTYSGCSGEDSLLVIPPGHLYFPNAFTPDGDGINEMFGPAGKYIEEFKMEIFDRWGQLVYSTEAIDQPWDGKVHGAQAMTGVYVYHFKAQGHLFPAIEDFGHVTLLRGSDEE
jgi:gliding motility-associated-like protein